MVNEQIVRNCENNCDLSRENVQHGYPFERPNAWLVNSKWTASERAAKPFETVTVNGWTAEEKFRMAWGERLKGWRKILNGLRWTA